MHFHSDHAKKNEWQAAQLLRSYTKRRSLLQHHWKWLKGVCTKKATPFLKRGTEVSAQRHTMASNNFLMSRLHYDEQASYLSTDR